MKTVVVVADGPGVPGQVELPVGATVIAADGGAEAGVPRVDLLVGDLDSISPVALREIEHVERHPVEKDATDLELALGAALRLEPERILVLGSSGGRLDHLLSSILLLGRPAYEGVQIDAQLGSAAVHVVRDDRVLHGAAGELVSLFALYGDAHGVVTEGLRYPLRGETLVVGSSRGVSNVFVAATARVRVASGVVAAIRPDGSVRVGSSS